mmetsp:Transcript_16795/g.54672  ORF Transcript_16795/g.54672 Transcript_16795/m.54672 type:complete len:202 (-) Transcript_16795:3795-4400(-)
MTEPKVPAPLSSMTWGFTMSSAKDTSVASPPCAGTTTRPEASVSRLLRKLLRVSRRRPIPWVVVSPPRVTAVSPETRLVVSRAFSASKISADSSATLSRSRDVDRASITDAISPLVFASSSPSKAVAFSKRVEERSLETISTRSNVVNESRASSTSSVVESRKETIPVCSRAAAAASKLTSPARGVRNAVENCASWSFSGS